MRDKWFEWDDNKAASNFAKHRVSFDAARIAFDDPDFIDVEDPDPDEERYNRICRLDDVLLVINYVERKKRIRIISVRRADQHEQETYFKQ